jgi:hypothetical protein
MILRLSGKCQVRLHRATNLRHNSRPEIRLEMLGEKSRSISKTFIQLGLNIHFFKGEEKNFVRRGFVIFVSILSKSRKHF